MCRGAGLRLSYWTRKTCDPIRDVTKWRVLTQTTNSAIGAILLLADQSDNFTQLQSLLKLATAGDDAAYNDLLKRASQRLLRLTRRMLRDFSRVRRWEETDDVFQLAVMRLYQSLSEVRPESTRAFFGLATTQIRRTLIDLARHYYGPEGHGAHHHSEADGRAADDGVLRQQPDTLGEPDSLDAWARFHELVGTLPEAEREVFNLLWYGGLPQAETATILGVSLPTVQRRWYRAQHFIHAAIHDA